MENLNGKKIYEIHFYAFIKILIRIFFELIIISICKNFLCNEISIIYIIFRSYINIINFY